MRQQQHIPTQLESRLSLGPAISLCNEPPMQCHHTTHFTTIEDFLSHTQRVEFSKMWNGANAQGKYNTISTSTVARHLWSRQNTKNTVIFFCACRNHFMQVKWYSMFILSCKVVRVCLLNEGWIHPGYRLSSPFSLHPSPTIPPLHHFIHPHCAVPLQWTSGCTELFWLYPSCKFTLVDKIECGIAILLCSSISKPEMCWGSFSYSG